jgi:DNA primase
MLERGFNAEELLEAGLVVEHEDKAKFDRFRNRLMFPITDKQGHVIGFGARALADGAQPKYLNSPQTPLFDKSSVLYGLGQAKSSIQHEDSVVIVEGYMDVIMAHQYGFKNVVASMGTAITEEHINLLENKAHTKKLIVALDYDEAGVKGSEHALYLEKYLDEEILVATMPPGEDPDEIIKRSTDDWKLLINTAHPLFDYVVERMYTKFDLNTIDGKSNAVEYFASILQETKNRKKSPYSLQKILNRYDFIPRLAATLGLDRKDLERTLSGYLARSNQNDRKTSKTASILSVGSHQVEDYCLTILLKHPELREQHGDLRPEYFDSSENREIYNVILGCDDISQVRAYLDSSLWEHYDRLLGHELLTNKLEAKLADAVLRLREEHLKRLAQNRADTLAVDEGNQLRELFVKKEHLGEQKRRQK